MSIVPTYKATSLSPSGEAQGSATASPFTEVRQRESLLVFFISFIIGAALFLVVYGHRILNPTYVDWILNAGGDLTQSYYGWRFFRASAWHFPIGLMDGVCYPFLTSIIYIDSVPLFNVIFKILSPLLPETFQFFGIWGLCCFALSAGIGSRIVHRLTCDRIGSVVASPVFALTTFVLQRLYVHTALGGNWVILLAVLVAVAERGRKLAAKDCLVWAGVFALGVGVNIYYLPILGVVMLFNAICHWRSDKSPLWPGLVFVSSVIGTFVCFWQLGGLYHLGSTGLDAVNTGELSANINSFINPMETGLYLTGFSGLLPTRDLVYHGQYEGYAYLGFGLITLCLCAVFGMVFFRQARTLNRSESICAIAAFVVLVFASWGVLVSFDGNVILQIPYPQIFNKIWSTFRSNGRFIWGAWDILAVAALVVVLARYPKQVARVVVAICVVLQIVDLRGFARHHRELYGVRQSSYEGTINLDDLGVLFADMQHIQILDPGRMLKLSLYYDLGETALQGGGTINDFYYSRRDVSSIVQHDDEERTALELGNPDPETLYVFSSMAEASSYQSQLHLYILDGLVFGRTSACDELQQAVEISDLAPAASFEEARTLASTSNEGKTMVCLDAKRKAGVPDDALSWVEFFWVNEDGGGHAFGYISSSDASSLDPEVLAEFADVEYWTFNMP